MEDNTNDTSKDSLFARWLIGNLTEQEKKDLEATGDAKIVEKIVSTVDQWSLPELNEQYYQKLNNKLVDRQQTKVVPMYKNKTILSIAASILLLVGLSVTYVLFFNSTIVLYQCEAGKKLEINLPDQTHVILNGFSSIAYDEKEWNNHREVKLTGEGYFEVTKKGPFKVTFERGDVDVLGTRFTIMSGKDIATIRCYEGKVSITASGAMQQLLTKGMAIRLSGANVVDSFAVSSNEPDWKSGENIFTEAPLLEVINALSIQYNTPFDISNSIDLNRKFTGKFIHSDLDSALNMVFTPMGIKYTVEGEKRKTVTLK